MVDTERNNHSRTTDWSKGFLLHDVRSYYTDSWLYNMGYHTLNHYNGVTVIDAHGYRFPLLGRLLAVLSKLIRWFVKYK